MFNADKYAIDVEMTANYAGLAAKRVRQYAAGQSNEITPEVMASADELIVRLIVASERLRTDLADLIKARKEAGGTDPMQFGDQEWPGETVTTMAKQMSTPNGGLPLWEAYKVLKEAAGL